MIVKTAKWLVLSFLLAAVSIHGHSVARRNLVNRAAKELVIEGNRLRSTIEGGGLTRPREIQAAFERTRRESNLNIAWIQLRDQSGVVTARVGEPPAGTVVVHKVSIQWPADHVAIIEIAARLDHPNPGAITRISKPEENNII